MATELLLAAGSSTWELVSESIELAVQDLAGGSVGRIEVSVPRSGQVVVGTLADDGALVLRAAGNETLEPRHRLTVHQERAMMATGFQARTETWGSFLWRLNPATATDSVVGSLVRTMRDVYRVDPGDLEVIVTL
ncbi:MAG: TY-Chap domain-containing protein [Acidimicrobiales bacterium]